MSSQVVELPSSFISEEFSNTVLEKTGQRDAAVNYQRDFDYEYFGFETVEKSYLLRMHGNVVKRPQHVLMRITFGYQRDFGCDYFDV